MASSSLPPTSYNYEFFKVTFPAPFVARVEIDRAEKVNAFYEPMWINLGAIFNRLSHDPDVRAVILTGAGDRGFTVGLDLHKAASLLGASEEGESDGADQDREQTKDVARKSVSLRRLIAEFQSCITAIAKCHKPVIGIFHGYSLGLAIDIAAACDVRIASEDVRFSVKEVDVGLAADIGTLSRLPKIVGSLSWVKEVCFTGRVFGAQEAVRVGFVTETGASKDEAVAKGLKLAKVIASKSPVAVMGTKHLIDYSIDHTVEEGLNYTTVWNSAMLQSDDVKRAVLSGMSKSPAIFSKL